MAWEFRRNRPNPYYTRTRRIAGRQVREYVGTGRVAELVAADDARQRAERLAVRAAWRAERARLEALDAPVDELDALADTLLRAYLTLAGYRQHDRGEWRRKRRDDAA